MPTHMNGISVNIIIDTDGVIKDYPNPSQDSKNPTELSDKYQYVVVSDNENIKGKATADLNFLAYPGVVEVNMNSEYNNLDNPVLIYDIKKIGDTQAFGNFNSESTTIKTIEPNGEDVLPPSIVDRKFWSYQKETKHYQIWFVMYQRVRGGEPKLFGYFYWDSIIRLND